jgi:hypothetical protein
MRIALWVSAEVVAMTFGYVQPFSFQIGQKSEPKNQPQAEPQTEPPPSKLASMRPGVTEVTLDDGRVVRATLHVKAVTHDPKDPGKLNVSYNIAAEIVAKPEMPMLDAHETIQ